MDAQTAATLAEGIRRSHPALASAERAELAGEELDIHPEMIALLLRTPQVTGWREQSLAAWLLDKKYVRNRKHRRAVLGACRILTASQPDTRFQLGSGRAYLWPSPRRSAGY